jgi:hypothetical protein
MYQRKANQATRGTAATQANTTRDLLRLGKQQFSLLEIDIPDNILE